MGQMIDTDERWEFYKAQNFERPSKRELKYLKGIIIPSCSPPYNPDPSRPKEQHVIKNKEPKDPNILKQAMKRGIGTSERSESEMASSVGASSEERGLSDLYFMDKKAMHIIGDADIKQNE